MVQQPMLLRPVQPVMITNIAGVKWYHLRCRAGFSPTRARRPVIARSIARHTVRAAGTLRLSGLGCSAICLTKRGGEYETNFYINFGNCAVCIICRRTINVVSIGLCRGGGRIYDNSEWFVFHRLYIRRYGGQLFGDITVRGVHYVCTSEYGI